MFSGYFHFFLPGNTVHCVAWATLGERVSAHRSPVRRKIPESRTRNTHFCLLPDALLHCILSSGFSMSNSSIMAMSTQSPTASRLTSAQRAVLHAAHECGALIFGSFTLKSSRVSPFFFDVGKFRDGRCMQLLAEAYAACIYESRLQYDIIFGPAYKGIPLATCTALMLASRYGQQAPFIYDRKEEKDHGEGGLLVGATEYLRSTQEGGALERSTDSPRVLVVDDVLTSGTALKSGIEKIRKVAPKTELVALVILLDRQEKQTGSEVSAAEAVATEYKTKVLPILTMEHLLAFLDELLESEHDPEKKKELQKHKQDMVQYRQQYGVNVKP